MPGSPYPSFCVPGVQLGRRALLANGAAALFGATAARGLIMPARLNEEPTSREALSDAFHNPPHEAGLGAYWYWLDGGMTHAGVTADLEAMHASGITTAVLFAIGAAKTPPLVSPPADALTPTWWSLVDHAVAEADRLNMTITMNICDGWATASGPWITPDISMQKVTWSDCRVAAGTVRPTLAPPPRLRDYYRDTAVFAFPWNPDFDRDSATLRPTVVSSIRAKTDLSRLLDPSNTQDVFNTTESGTIDFRFDAPFTLRSVTVRTPSPWGYSPGVYRAANSLLVEASDDGVSFEPVGALEYPRHGWQTDMTTLTHAVPETTARVFRFRHVAHPAGPYQENYDFGEDMRLRLFSLELSSTPELHQTVGKRAEQWSIARRTDSRDIPKAACVDPNAILNLTDRLNADGTLEWTAPPGHWRVLRIGATTNGHQNSAAGGAQGLEVDRFNRVAVELQFRRWFGAALDRVGSNRAGRVLNAVHVDSWEASGQNWSPHFLDQFRAARGYDLTPWLPVMAGVPIASAEASEGVLHDIRQTIAELTQSEFFETVARLAHARGCRFTAEPASPTYAVDGLRWAEAADMPMGEFWLRTPRNDKPTDIADAVSGGHIYGKRVIGAESFTENDIKWDEHPYMLKPLGDRHYCRGINRLMLHVYTGQPFLDRAPGMTLNGIGTMFSRTQVWWRQARGWFDYMRRCQAVLQRGRAVADIAVFIGEEIPSRAKLASQLDRPIPQGFTFDSIDRTVLMSQARVENGWVVLAGGARYRLLILPDNARYSADFLAALLRLIEAGAVVSGGPPLGPVGLSLSRFDALAKRLWGNAGATGFKRIGAGQLRWGTPVAHILEDIALAPDLLSDRPVVSFTHRSAPDWDAWFVSNASDQPIDVSLSLRTTADDVSLWHPDSGTQTVAPVWQRRGGRIALPLALDPFGTVLVVACKAPAQTHALRIDRADEGLLIDADPHGPIVRARARGSIDLTLASGRSLSLACDNALAPIALNAPWQLRFSGWHAPDDIIELPRPVAWTTLTPPRVRDHAGSGAYRTSCALATGAFSTDRRIILDLGVVRELAEVVVNGRALATLWKPPFHIDITDALKPGENILEIIVTNVWHNRLAGDQAIAEAERATWVYPHLRGTKSWLPEADAPRIPAGLIGPVRLVAEQVLRIPHA